MNIQEAAQFMGVQLSITKDELKSKYRDLVKQYHPDVSNHANSEELVKKLNESYRLLKDTVPTQYPSFNQHSSFGTQTHVILIPWGQNVQITINRDMFAQHFRQNPPPKPPPEEWKRSQANNLYKHTLGKTIIIFPSYLAKEDLTRYKLMIIHQPGNQKEYLPQLFETEEAAQIEGDKLAQIRVIQINT